MRSLPLVALALLSCPPSQTYGAGGDSSQIVASAREATGYAITMPRPLLHELGHLADTATIEHVRCLYGVARPDTVHLLWAFEPEIGKATTTYVRHESCPAVALASWHNHLAGVTMTGTLVPGEDPRSSCYLSGVDLRAAREYASPKILFVQVTRDVRCWWSQEQAIRSGLVGALGAFPEQRAGFGP